MPTAARTPASAFFSCALPWSLDGSVLGASHLFKLVQQSLVTDLQLLCRAAPAPTGAGQSSQDDFLLRFARGGPRRLLQRNPAAIAPHVRPQQHGAPSSP